MSQEIRSPSSVLAFCRELDVKVVCLRFTDFLGRFRGVRIPFSELKEESFEYGFGLNASDIICWRNREMNDFLLVPQADGCFFDPFCAVPTLNLFCGLQDPVTREDLAADVRAIAIKATAYMASCGFADRALVGADLEFNLVPSESRDSLTSVLPYGTVQQCGRGPADDTFLLEHDIGECTTASNRETDSSLLGQPADEDFTGNVIGEILRQLAACRVQVDSQRLRCPIGNWASIGVRAEDPIRAADSIATAKYVIRCVAHRFSKTAIFLPRLNSGQRDCGLPINICFFKGGDSLFAGTEYAGLSPLGLGAVGGLLKHLPSLCGLVAPSTISYHRLCNASRNDSPVFASFSRNDQQAAVRIPTFSSSPRNRRIEFGCPDSTTNPYVAISALIMSMIDGAQNKQDAGIPLEVLKVEKPQALLENLVPQSLDRSLSSLEVDHDYLTRGGVFLPEFVDAWIACKRQLDLSIQTQVTHPQATMLYIAH